MPSAPRGASRAVALGSCLAVVLAGCGTPASVDATSTTASPPATSAPLWAPPGSSAMPAKSRDSLQSALDDWVSERRLVGATAAVVTPAGTWSGAAGVDGARRRLKADSAMWIASVTKTFTAAEVMLLSWRGLVSLDRPVTDYVDVPFDTGGATVRDLLAMRSGFPEYSWSDYRAAISADLGRDWTPEQMLATLPADATSRSTRGGTPVYNSVNYVVLAQLIAAVTGQPYATALRTDLLDPSGLDRIWVQTAEQPTAPSSVGTDPPMSTLVDPAGAFLPSTAVASFTGGGGGMAGDALGVARWGYLLYGGQVIDSSLVLQMEADPQEEPEVGPYALGTTVVADAGTLVVGHGGGGPQWPYTSVLAVWTGEAPVAVAVLTPQPADVAADLAGLAWELDAAAAG